VIFSPDKSGNPFLKKSIFSWQETTTNGSSFFDLEKKILEKKIETNGGIGFK
jgi:hypothetical protein